MVIGRFVIIRVMRNWTTAQRESDQLFIRSMITDRPNWTTRNLYQLIIKKIQFPRKEE